VGFGEVHSDNGIGYRRVLVNDKQIKTTLGDVFGVHLDFRFRFRFLFIICSSRTLLSVYISSRLVFPSHLFFYIDILFIRSPMYIRRTHPHTSLTPPTHFSQLVPHYHVLPACLLPSRTAHFSPHGLTNWDRNDLDSERWWFLAPIVTFFGRLAFFSWGLIVNTTRICVLYFTGRLVELIDS